MMPEFKVDYEPDFRQKIADAWPKSIDDHDSKNDWGWSYDVTVDDLARKIMDGIAPEYKKNFKMHKWLILLIIFAKVISKEPICDSQYLVNYHLHSSL